jgi:SEC-C motif-containing protein
MGVSAVQAKPGMWSRDVADRARRYFYGGSRRIRWPSGLLRRPNLVCLFLQIPTLWPLIRYKLPGLMARSAPGGVAIRGGSWDDLPRNVRAAYCNYRSPDFRNSNPRRRWAGGAGPAQRLRVRRAQDNRRGGAPGQFREFMRWDIQLCKLYNVCFPVPDPVWYPGGNHQRDVESSMNPPSPVAADAACPCGTARAFGDCCGPILNGERPAPTAEALMRSRYSAYVVGRIGYLRDSLDPDHREDLDLEATRRWAGQSRWLGLEVRATEQGGPDDGEGVVEFVATYKERGGLVRPHHERARFRRHQGHWFYVSGEILRPATEKHRQARVGRNDSCPCGSGLKFKKCCGR